MQVRAQRAIVAHVLEFWNISAKQKVGRSQSGVAQSPNARMAAQSLFSMD